jgi:bifunctional DNA-binding transcriptional regulator/antitoxin component of YhaV-PrlF toxin-antitoxin module
VGKVRLLNKGKVTIPKAIRMAHQWLAGTEFAVVSTEAGVLLTPLKSSGPTTVRSLRAMEQGIAKAPKEKK